MRLIDDWTDREWRFSPVTWRRDVLASRIVAWIRHYDWLAAAADPAFAARFVFSLGRQRTHLKRALRTGLVGHEAVAALKAFPHFNASLSADGESLVEALATPQFYRDCHDRLNKGGMLVVNLWGGDRQFNDTVKRIEAAFPDGTLCLPAERPGNIIVFGFRSKPAKQEWQELWRRATALEKDYGLAFPRFVEGLRKMNKYDSKELLF